MTTNEIKKLYVQETILFVATNIPGVDPITLEQFSTLINTDGSFKTISQEQLMTRMSLMITYIPTASNYSLRVAADFLEIPTALLPGEIQNAQPNNETENDHTQD